MTHARFIQRLCASCVDGVIWVGAVFALRALVGNGPAYADIHRSYTLWFEVGPGRVADDLAVLFAWFYYAGCESSPWQATLGKRMLGIAVADRDGERVSFLRATARYFAHGISALPLLLGYLIMPFTRRKQALHDLISGCLVVDAREVSPAPFTSVRVGTLAVVLAGLGLAGGLALLQAPTPSVYIVPLGQLTAGDATLLARDVAAATHVKAAVLGSFPLVPEAYDNRRRQVDSESIEAQIRAHYPSLLKHDNAVIGITSDDMYTSTVARWQFAFSSRDDEHVAVVSLARMVGPDEALLRSRADRMIRRQVDVLHFHMPLSSDPNSVLYANVLSVADIDRMALPDPTT